MSETNEKNKEKCFVIMPISDQGDYPVGHFTKVYEQIIKPSIEDAGYEAYRVDENNICDTIINKIFDAIQECPMAICDLSNRNPNVLYELGLRQAYDKPVVLIQDEKTDKIFDVSGISTVFYKSARLYEDVIEARENITKAILATKEGKVNTLAKIMKVSAADFSQIEVSQDDRINLILEGIYSEIRKLKNENQKNYLSPDTIKSGNNDILLNFNTNAYLMLEIKCNDSNIVSEFSEKIFKNMADTLKTRIQKIEDDIWELYIYSYSWINMFDRSTMVKEINEISKEFDITILNIEFLS